MAYAVGQGGCLSCCGAADAPRGGLMGLSDRCTGSLMRADALCRTIATECARRGFHGVLADFDGTPCADRLPFLSRLARCSKVPSTAVVPSVWRSTSSAYRWTFPSPVPQAAVHP